MPYKDACAKARPELEQNDAGKTSNDFYDSIRQGLHDWIDFEVTPRRIIARRQDARTFRREEAAAMHTAKALLDDGRISIIAKPTRDNLGRPVVTYIAERVK